ELLGRKIDYLAVAAVLAHMPSHRVHQMRLAETDAAVKKQRIERYRVTRARAGLGDAPCRGVRQLVGLADDEILEDEPVVESQELRLVVADFERRERSSRRRRIRRGFRITIRGGEMIPGRPPPTHAAEDRYP